VNPPVVAEHCEDPEPYEPDWVKRMADAEQAQLESKYYAEDTVQSPTATITVAEDDNGVETGRSKTTPHAEPESSFSAKTQGLPQQVANPEQYARDNPTSDSTGVLLIG